MTAIETLDDVYATLVEKADSGTVAEYERRILRNAADDIRFRKTTLEFVAEERQRREMIGFGPVGAVLAR